VVLCERVGEVKQMKRPIEPRKPYRPYKPYTESYDVYLSARISKNNKIGAQKLQQIFHQGYERHERRYKAWLVSQEKALARYQKQMEKYQRDIAEYKRAMRKYKTDMNDYMKWFYTQKLKSYR
jgi:hypothetical protein